MSDLRNETVVKADSKVDQPLSVGEQDVLLQSLDGWRIEREGETKVVKDFKFDNFVQAIAFVNKVADLAEEHDHHPFMGVTWGKVHVQWWTHSLKGLQRNDFVMAAKTDAIATGKYPA